MCHRRTDLYWIAAFVLAAVIVAAISASAAVPFPAEGAGLLPG